MAAKDNGIVPTGLFISWSFLVFPRWVFLLSAYFTGQHPPTLWASRQR
jgi:hypothetical protein